MSSVSFDIMCVDVAEEGTEGKTAVLNRKDSFCASLFLSKVAC